MAELQTNIRAELPLDKAEAAFAAAGFPIGILIPPNATVGVLDASEAFWRDVRAELDRARQEHPAPIHSLPEALGVVRKEYLHVEREALHCYFVESRVRGELVELAAACLRAVLDLGL